MHFDYGIIYKIPPGLKVKYIQLGHELVRGMTLETLGVRTAIYFGSFAARPNDTDDFVSIDKEGQHVYFSVDRFEAAQGIAEIASPEDEFAQVANLAAFYDPIGEGPGFVLPLLQIKTAFLTQRKKDERVIGFHAITLDADDCVKEVIPDQRREVRIGDSHVWAFATIEGRVIAGSRAVLVEALQQEIPKLSSYSNLLVEINNFIKETREQVEQQ